MNNQNKPKKTFMYTPSIQLSSDDEDDEFYHQIVQSSKRPPPPPPPPLNRDRDNKPCNDDDRQNHHSLKLYSIINSDDDEQDSCRHFDENPSSSNNNNNSTKQFVNVPLSHGLNCLFPFNPYPSQIEFMNRIIYTLLNHDGSGDDEKGMSHAILESPTVCTRIMITILYMFQYEFNI